MPLWKNGLGGVCSDLHAAVDGICLTRREEERLQRAKDNISEEVVSRVVT